MNDNPHETSEGVDMGSDADLATAITELSYVRRRPFDEERFADDLARHSARLLSADDAGVLLADADDRLSVASASSRSARLLQVIQVHYEAGPSIVSYRDRRPVSVADVREERRYGDIFRFATSNAGFSAVHAFPLLLNGEAVGTLILFRSAPGELDAEERVVGKALASMATAILLAERDLSREARRTVQLETALCTRIVIEQAKGILAERHGLPMNSAFEAMRSFARNSRRRLDDVARAVIEDNPSTSRLSRRRSPAGAHTRIASVGVQQNPVGGTPTCVSVPVSTPPASTVPKPSA